MRAAGFTLIELVVTILLLGIVAAVAMPRFFQARTFDSRGFYDKATATVRYAQKTAVAWRRAVYVCVTATEVAAGAASGCAPPLTNPVNGKPLRETAPAGVTLNAVEFTFDGLGRPSAGTTITFTSTIAGDPARQIVVAAETGYVVAN
ncbi:MAG: type II secretion system protein [Burkholderiales bacterium]|nr:type II secretion system protein [Burkholderiales bacterium]